MSLKFGQPWLVQKYVHTINDRAVQGHLSENYLTWKNEIFAIYSIWNRNEGKFKELRISNSYSSWFSYLANSDCRGSSRESRHTRLESSHIRELATATRVDSADTKLVCLPWLKLYLLYSGCGLGRNCRLGLDNKSKFHDNSKNIFPLLSILQRVPP